MITSAGIVKIVPAAIDEPAEAPVATMLFSRMLERPSSRSTPIETTAAGIAVATVSPANRPRYAFAAASSTVRISERTIARTVNCRAGSAELMRNSLCQPAARAALLAIAFRAVHPLHDTARDRPEQ